MNTTYTTLAANWMQAKAKENEWKDRRLAVEAEMLKLFPDLPEEGQRSFKEGSYKTTVSNGLNIKIVNREAFSLAVQEGVIPTTIVHPDLYETGFKRLRRMAIAQDPGALAVYGTILPLFNITPAKPGVSVSKVA